MLTIDSVTVTYVSKDGVCDFAQKAEKLACKGFSMDKLGRSWLNHLADKLGSD